MSTSDLYILNSKSVTHLAEFRNGWGSGPRCWDHLSEKYLGRSTSMFDMKPVWALARDDRVQRHEKIALMMTFDRAYVPLANLADAASALARFGLECKDEQRVNHWPAFADALIEAARMKHSRHARGVCLTCTSVNDVWANDPTWPLNAWSIYEEEIV